MGNIIKVDFKGDDEKNGYSTQCGSLVGVVNKTTGLEMWEHSPGEFEIFKCENTQTLSRKELAEWLWMAAHLLDSEGRYKFDEYVGLNYKDGE